MDAGETNDPVRGSGPISEELFGKPGEVPKQALRQLLGIARTQGVSLEGWWTRGRPGIEAITGRMRVKPEIAGEIFRQLLTVDKVPLKVEGFPLGVLNPELIEIRFSTPGE